MDNKFPGKDISSDDQLNKFPLSSSKKKNIVNINKHISFGGKYFPIISGPNTLENRDLIFKYCEFLEKQNLKLVRAAIYKPLTFPYRSKKYFEMGDKGIKILEDIKKNFDVLLVTEIMESSKIEILNNLVDIFQIGARNMQNFPLVCSVAKTKKPIILKRHFGCSIRDLFGAAEYILLKKNKKVILCERGVSAPHTHRSTSRFILDIQSIPAIKEYSCMPVIVDPSHACFWYKWVADLALASFAVGSHGLILEVHPDPRNSAVDPLQALGFDDFKKLIKKIKNISKIFNRIIV